MKEECIEHDFFGYKKLLQAILLFIFCCNGFIVKFGLRSYL